MSRRKAFFTTWTIIGNTDVQICKHARMHAYILACKCTHMPTHIHADTHIHTHKHVYTHKTDNFQDCWHHNQYIHVSESCISFLPSSQTTGKPPHPPPNQWDIPWGWNKDSMVCLALYWLFLSRCDVLAPQHLLQVFQLLALTATGMHTETHQSHAIISKKYGETRGQQDRKYKETVGQWDRGSETGRARQRVKERQRQKENKRRGGGLGGRKRERMTLLKRKACLQQKPKKHTNKKLNKSQAKVTS